MNDLSQDRLLLVARVVRVHGIRGEMKMMPETDDPERLRTLQRVFLGDTEARASEYGVERLRVTPSKHGITVVAKLAGIDTPEAAEALRGTPVFAREADLPSLAEDEYFLHDLVGLKVLTPEGALVGTVRQVIEMPAQNLLEVERPEGGLVLIPAVAEFVVETDVTQGRLVVRPIEGLLDSDVH